MTKPFVDPAPRPALVASDLDGTLLRTDGTASRRTVEAVRALQDAGIHWVVATARPPRWLHDLSDVIGDGGLAICSNGAFVYDATRRAVVSERTLAQPVLHLLVERLRSEIPDVVFAVENGTGFGCEPGYPEEYPVPPGSPVAEVHGLLEPLPGKLMARSPTGDPHDFLERVTAVVGDAAVVSSSGAVGLAEISAAGVTKAAVLADHCAALGVTAERVWAFGDMPNDVPMLSWAGRSFAMANGHPEAHRAADHVCAANDEDGVASVLEQVVGPAALNRPGRAQWWPREE